MIRSKCTKLTKNETEVIESSIRHLNGYALILKAKNIPSPAVKEDIQSLRRILKKECK